MIVDGDQETDTQEIIGRMSLEADLLDGAWTHKLTGTFNDFGFDFFEEGAASGGSEEQSRLLSYQTTYRFDTPAFYNSRHTVVGLVEHREDTYRNKVPLDFFGAPPVDFQLAERKRDTTSVAGEYRADFAETVSLSAAVRHDSNSGFEDATTWRLTGAYSIPGTGTRLHSSVGTGVTNPTFVEQFGIFSNFIPNPDLVPEESLGWDIGVEQTLLDGALVVDVTYFEADLENEIVSIFLPPNFDQTPINLDGKSKRRGVEISGTWTPVEWLSLSGAYTYIDSKDPDGRAEIRRPRHAARLDGTVRFDEGRGRLTTSVVYNGETPDDWFTVPTTRVMLDDYFLVDAVLAYQLTPEMEVYGRVENLFDESYENVFSFQSPGFAAYAGLKVKLGAPPASSGL